MQGATQPICTILTVSQHLSLFIMGEEQKKQAQGLHKLRKDNKGQVNQLIVTFCPKVQALQ